MTSANGTALVVDDDQVNRLLLTTFLEEQDYVVVVAPNGRCALEVVVARPVDVILLDLVMPELDGFAVLRRLKGDPALAHIPVIVISALDEMESVVRSIELGAADHLAKPVDPVLLRARLSTSLAAKRLRDQEQEYLQQVSRLTTVAAAVQSGTFDLASLQGVAERPDELGGLARVFCQMLGELRSREHRLHEQNRVKSAFISRMTHELRSPFVAASFSVELLRRYVANGMADELSRQIELLDRDLAAGRRLIDGMITFASLVERKIQLSRARVSPESLIRSATAHLESIAESRGVTLSYTFGPGLPDIDVDPGYLGDAVAHLVHNAIKFNHEGGRALVAAWLVDSTLIIKVSDTGCGIPPRQLDLIWEAFGHTADDERRSVDGLGLGLALVKQIVELHGGEVVAISRQGQGSTFGFRLPTEAGASGVA